MDPKEWKIISEIISKWLYQNITLKKQNLVYYYTDINALLNGIIAPDPIAGKEVCLWATRCTYMNDKQEMQEGMDSVREVLSDMEDNQPLLDLLFRDVWKGHSISFSMTKDSLPMWNMYGEHASGVMLAFDKSFLNNNYQFFFTSCIYTDSYHQRTIKRRIRQRDIGPNFNSLSQQNQMNLFFLLMDLYVMLLKNKSFSYEQEVRISGLGTKFDNVERITKYRKNNIGIIVPYFEVYFPKDILKEVWLGPNQDMDLSANSLKEFLQSKGFDKTTVHKSTIPFRG